MTQFTSSAPWPVFNQIYSLSELERETTSDGIDVFLSAPVAVSFPFSSLVPSVNFHVEKGCSVLLEAQVFAKGKWSDFYKFGLFSEQLKTSYPNQQDEFGRVQTDVLLLDIPAEAYRLRVRLSKGGALTFLAATLGLCPFIYDEKSAARLPLGTFEREILLISQLEQTHPDRRRICSPTSLTMALNSLGIKASLLDVMQHVFDQTSHIYGNWIFNVAAAGSLGAQAYVRRFGALSELNEFLTQDSLVIASVAYGKGELAGAPLDHTAGHLLVVRGWKDGKVLVADPAAPAKESVLRAYQAHEFANAWLNHKQGLAYIVRKK